MKKAIEIFKKAIRTGKETIEAAYFGRLWVLGLLFAFLMPSIFPGFDVQNQIPILPFVFLVALVYFVLLQGVLFLQRRYFKKYISNFVVEVFLLIFCIYTLKEILYSVNGIGVRDDEWEWGIAAALTVVPWIFAHCVTLFFQGKNRILHGIFSVLMAIAVAGSGYFVFSQGWDRTENPTLHEIYQNEKIVSKYSVEVVEYGPDKELDFGILRMSDRASTSGWKGKLRNKIMGYGLGNIPYKGKIYLPVGMENVPLLLFVHGNHNMIADNMGGYDYLGRFLASQGYAFVTVDHSIFNAYMGAGTGNENDARALSLLEHANRLKKENELPDSPLYNRFDFSKLVLGGHSRGGEAAATAAYFNQNDFLVDDGFYSLPEKLEIAGVLAVAPTYGQYLPSDHSVELSHLSYLVLQGTHDQDVSSFQGMNQYKYVHPGEGQIKKQVLISKANHGQFNANWGRRDKSYPNGFFLNTEDLLKKEDQEKILEVYALGFMGKIDGKEEEIWRNLPKYLPKTRYFQRYEKGHLEMVANFEEDSRLETATIPEGKIFGEDMGIWKEELFETSTGNPSKDHVVKISLPREKSFVLEWNPLENSPQSLSMDVAFEEEPMDLEIALTDAFGNRSVVSSKDWILWEEKEETALTKWQQIAEEYQYKNSLQTLEIPIKAFQENNPDLYPGQIQKMEIFSEEYGEIYLDNIGFYS